MTAEPELTRRQRFDSIAEAERLARRRLPRAMYQRLMNGTDDGLTYAANLAAFGAVSFRPRGAAVDPKRSAATTVLGTEVGAPVLLGPVGALRLQHPAGVTAAIDAAARFGTVCAVSPGAGHPLKELPPPPGGALWYQVTTALGGRAAAEADLTTAADLGYRAMVVTIDSGLRPKVPALRLTPATVANFAPDLVRHPRWTVGFVRDGMRLSVANTATGAASSGAGRPVEWDDLRWIVEQWSGPAVVKGVVTAEDARRAVDLGAAAVIVSNHGGLTLDGAPSTLSVLPEIVAAVGSQVEVMLDGGVRSGRDVVKALALGARAVLLGRAYVIGLAVAGTGGVGRVLEIFHDEILRALAFLGCSSVHDLNPSHVSVPRQWDPA